MNYKILPLVCLASALMLLGCYKLEKLEGGKTARINTVTGETVVINNDGTIVVNPVPAPSPSSAKELMALKTLTTFVPESGYLLKIEFKYRYRNDRLEYILEMDIKEAAFIIDALKKDVNRISVILSDAQGFEIQRIPFKNFTRIEDDITTNIVALSLQDSCSITVSDFKRISNLVYNWSYSEEFKSEMNTWRLKAEAKKSKSTATTPPK